MFDCRRMLTGMMLLLIAIVATDAPRAEAADAIVLFDGSSTDAWRGYKKKGFPKGWAVEDGALVRRGAAGDIITKEKFGDFELELEFKVSPGANSGII